MRIIWIEDFGEVKEPEDSLVSAIFQDLLGQKILYDKWSDAGIMLEDEPQALLEFCQKYSISHEIILCRHYHDFEETIAEYELLQDIDVILIDINLSAGVDPDKPLPAGYEHEKGGFYIYNSLIREGFPNDSICFLTGEKNSSLIPFEQQCEKIYMPKPQSFEKTDSEYARLRAWLNEKQANRYFTLRRGIIEGCRYILSQLESRSATEVIKFNQFLEQGNADEMDNDMRDYLKIVQNFLPLRQPKDKHHIYKLFIRTLAHEWEMAKPALVGGAEERQLQTFGWIMKNVRNWAAHTNLFENIEEKYIAFLFLLNMRSLFQLNATQILPFEKALLLTFFDNPLSQQDLSSLIDEKSLNLATSYSLLKKQIKSDKEDAVTFAAMLNNLINSDQILQQDIGSRLLQMFWHGLSPARVQNVVSSKTVEGRIKNAGIWYTFKLHHYAKDNPETFLSHLARHIYSDSHLE
ncbi:MAG: hypothetical protein DRR16_29630 [Candidatus Parabeggiatoa sp. nov. 3]|nr:MAG: hypothetical protein DRR00_09180 [Gammaproteobacteria bacterium]RKZ55842.1 MAG: hypothetical protein DRQ99_29465 [Gammaproteobacteria bacterium]RKZ77463.1 MAG: hypothetical protein DRR16_29630 [Gammaproteobacteria bacterium]HEW98333.1 hypothetical protein [Beggiatoa sp.]